MKVEIPTSWYNKRRYSSPWIAKVIFQGTKAQYEFGEWIGTPGAKGLLVIDAVPGDIIAKGQKDYRGKASEHRFFILQENGELKQIDRVEAYHYWETKQAAAC